jgi:hypothetical protein
LFKRPEIQRISFKNNGILRIRNSNIAKVRAPTKIGNVKLSTNETYSSLTLFRLRKRIISEINAKSKPLSIIITDKVRPRLNLPLYFKYAIRKTSPNL